MQTLPLLPLRGLTVFPYMTLHFDAGREKSLAALSAAMSGDQRILLVCQRALDTADPGLADLYAMGTICTVKQVLALPGDNIRVLAEGVMRARLVAFTREEPYVLCQVEEIDQTADANGILSEEDEAIMRVLTGMIEEMVQLSGKVNRDTLLTIGAISDPGQFADVIASDVLTKVEDKQTILEIEHPIARMEALMTILRREIDVLRIERRIQQRVRRSIDRSQKEYYLREQMRAIEKELGEKDHATEMDELRQKAEQMPLSEQARQKVNREIDRLSRMQASSPEASVSRTYIDTILELPWGKYTQDDLDLTHAEAILHEDHFGLEKVKERVLEYLSVAKLKPDSRGPILCFVGPPGTGKTSIARSIARALGRSFCRMSLGGVRDEAEIRGHRRTYIGAIPGAVMEHIRQAGTMNPVFLLDEIDKMASDFRGDPASAMLEVLDPEQNKSFNDHYLELDFDLSHVLFITTANSLDTIARPLLDRMEVIEVSSYTAEEKVQIARRYLCQKQAELHGLAMGEDLVLPDETLMALIRSYTAESGVRNLERQIAAVCRKVARKIAQGEARPQTVLPQDLDALLGRERVHHDALDKRDKVGVATGLAWTAIGGTTLQIEVGVMPGTGKVELTGQLGDVMKESAMTAISYLRAHAQAYGIDEAFYREKDLHIHIPEGATPKDGPSAGITLATAVLSALTGQKVRGDLAMTGEITLTGRVLPVGGIREKLLAALREGVHEIVLPAQNERDLLDIDEQLRAQLSCTLVERLDQVLEKALVREG